MIIEDLLYKGRVVSCYNSLLIDVRLDDDSQEAVFCASSEAAALCKAGTEVFVRRAPGNLRKVRYELEYLNLDEGLVFVNPSVNRKLFLEAFENGVLKDFGRYENCREIEPDDHLQHVDFELSSAAGEKCFVFIEDVYNKTAGYSVFPAGINFFEMEMFEEMEKLRAEGHRTCIFMLVPRQDSVEAKFSWNLDPIAAAKIFDEAKKGLNFVCYGCILDKKSVSIARKMKIIY